MSPWEGVDTGALMMDDQCVAGDVECGLNALQMRGMRKELDEEPSEKIIGSVMTFWFFKIHAYRAYEVGIRKSKQF